MKLNQFCQNLNYQNLPDINEANYFSPKQDFTCFQDIAKVLHSHQLLDKYVITLLHTHFNIDEDEILAEFKEEYNIVVKTPIAVNSAKEYNLKASSWRLVDSEDKVFLPLEYTTLLESEDLFQIENKDIQAFNEVVKVLVAHGNINRFGLGFAYQELELKDDETSLEQTDLLHRQLILKPTLKASIKNIDVQTSWKLKEDIIYAMASCSTEYETNCRRFCEESSYCKRNPNGSDELGTSHDTITRHKGAVHNESRTRVHRRK